MLSTLTAAWRTTFQRLAADWLILGAALVTITLSAVLLSTGPIYANAVTIGALHRSLADAAVPVANLEITHRTPPGLYELTDRVVADAVAATFSQIGASVMRHVEAESFELPSRPEDATVGLAGFQYFDDIASHATLASGTWPEHGPPPFETALSQTAASALGFGLGDEFVVSNRRDPTIQVTMRLVGVYEVDSTADPFWFDDPLATQGVVEQTAFNTYGPFVVDLETILTGLTPRRATTGWRVYPEFDDLAVAGVSGLAARVSALETELNESFGEVAAGEAESASEFSVKSGLTKLLGETQRSLTVTRASVLALLVQLAVLAGYALVLTAGLLVETRRTETVLLRSRGASPAQILTIALLEGVILTLPAVVAAPAIAAAAMRVLNRIGPLASAGLTIAPEPTIDAYVLSGLAALGSLVALSWPAFRSAREFHGSSRRHRRQQGRSVAQRAGVDVALVALAAIAFWQLRSLGPQLTARVEGRFGVDPLLVLAPALGLLAGGVLALRVIPLIANIAERIASSGRSTVPALSAWQVARRPIRYARSALLLIMAVTIGFFAASFSTTWLESQTDQAAFQTGADIRVTPNRRTGDSISDLTLAASHAMIDGVEASMPVVRRSAQLTRSSGTGLFTFLDAARATSVVHLRADLGPDFADLMAEMVARRPTLASVPLPGTPTRIGLLLSASEDVPEEPSEPETDEPAPPYETAFDPRVSAILQDGDGLLHRVSLGSLPLGDGPTLLEASLTTASVSGADVGPSYPISLVGVEILSPTPLDFPRRGHLSLNGVLAAEGEGDFERVEIEANPANWVISRSAVGGLAAQPGIAFAENQPSDALLLDITTGVSVAGTVIPAYFSIRPSGTVLPPSFPVVVTPSFLSTNAVEVGDIIRLTALRTDNDEAQIVGVIAAFPTVDPGSGEAIVIDLPTYQMVTYAPGADLAAASEYWLATTGHDDGSIQDALTGAPFRSFNVQGLGDRVASLASDPVALGTIGALSLGFVAAAVFAAVGFAVSATVSARERITEFALLRALGLSPRQLGSWLSVEQGVLVLLSLGLGTLIGVLLTGAILPQVSLTQAGAEAVPAVIVIYPWRTVMWLEVGVLAVLAVIVIIMTVLLRRLGLGSLLRLGED